VLTDPNNVKYKGNSNIAIGADPNAYVQAHMTEWLAAIYAQNTDPNVPDWVDTHPGKYLAGLTLINNISSLADAKAVMRKVFKAIYPGVADLED